MTLHSFTFDNIDEELMFGIMMSGIDALLFGSIIDMEKPLSINIKVQESLEGKPISEH